MVKPDDISFFGFTIHPNNTYEFTYSEHDVGGYILNLGNYSYNKDTLELLVDKKEYFKTVTKPIEHECEKRMLTINLKTFGSSFNENGIIDDSPPPRTRFMGVNSNRDTFELWHWKRSSPLKSCEILLERHTYENVENIWLEMNSEPMHEPILLPKSNGCLKINYPIVWTNLIRDEPITWGMNRFIIRERNSNYYVESIQREKTYKLKNSK